MTVGTTIVWTSETGYCDPSRRSALHLGAGDSLRAGHSLWSPNSRYKLTFHGTIRQLTMTFHRQFYTIVDGSLVCYDGAHVMWRATNANWGSGGYRLHMQLNGNVLLLDKEGRVGFETGVAHPEALENPVFKVGNDGDVVMIWGLLKEWDSRTKFLLKA